jgi:hypothetical protein
VGTSNALGGAALQHDPMLQQKLRCLTSTVAMSAIVSAGLLLFAIEPAFAEFEIQEAEIDKGEIEIEYRGAYHWALPVAIEGQDVNDLVQSHELEFQLGITNWWMISAVAGFDQPKGEDLDAPSGATAFVS